MLNVCKLAKFTGLEDLVDNGVTDRSLNMVPMIPEKLAGFAVHVSDGNSALLPQILQSLGVSRDG